MARSSESSEIFARELARLLEERRLSLGYSKLALAQRAGVDQRTVTFIETGINAPSITTLHSLCEALEIPVGEMVTAADVAARSQKRKKPTE